MLLRYKVLTSSVWQWCSCLILQPLWKRRNHFRRCLRLFYQNIPTFSLIWRHLTWRSIPKNWTLMKLPACLSERCFYLCLQDVGITSVISGELYPPIEDPNKWGIMLLTSALIFLLDPDLYHHKERMKQCMKQCLKQVYYVYTKYFQMVQSFNCQQILQLWIISCSTTTFDCM